jgi:hypothetical protein
MALAQSKAAKSKSNDAKAQKSESKLVDSGSFGIYVNGSRIATEVFEIQQNTAGSVTRSELTLESGSTRAIQSAELSLNPMGELRRYQWSEKSPGKALVTVETDGELLTEQLYASAGEKPVEQKFLLPPSTFILDDYFFVQRQLIAWRYLGASCHTEATGLQCRLAKAQLGVLVPRQRASLSVSLEYTGSEPVNIKGTPQTLQRFKIDAEGTEWNLWLDDSHHLLRVTSPSQNVEVLRD